MIEKVMKAVKRSSKRRSVNITIGAVVGFLLSCTAVMGAAVEIRNVDGNFGVTKDIEGNTFEDKIYTNNGEIAGEDIGISVTGVPANIKLSIVNNGSISGKEGIKTTDAYLKGDIINNGNIESTNGHGIDIIRGTTTGDIVNNGIITTKSGNNLSLSGTLNVNVINKGMLINDSDSDSEAAAISFNKLQNVQNDGFISVVSAGASSGIKGGLEGNLYNTGAIETEGAGSGDSNSIFVVGTATGNIENTGAISSVNSGTGKSYGINIDGTVGNIKNDGVINTSTTTANSYAIYNAGTITGNIENIGIINTTSDENYACGIYIHSDSEIKKDIINRGLITSAITSNAQQVAIGVGGFGIGDKISNTGYINVNNNERNAFGILVGSTSSNGKVNRITNTGNIYANSEERDGNGIEIDSTPEGGTDITNDGLINTTKYGIEIEKAGIINTLVKSLINGGVIYGKESAIFKDGSAQLKTDNNNYGLLISEGNDRDSILSGTNFTEIKNYGLAFSVGTEGNAGKYYVQTNKNYTGGGRTIVNAELIKTGNYDITGEVDGTKSVLSANLTDGGKYIINGIDKTLVVDEDITLKTSMINAYGTAMVMDDGKALTVEETIFNGGVDGKSETISLAGNNTLDLSNNSIVNGNMKIAGGNNTLSMDKSSVNGKITAGGGSNKLTVAGSYLNDELAITGNNNTLDMSESSMNGKVAATGDNNNLTIADSGINDEIAITGDKNTLDITDSNLNKNIAIDGENNTLTIAGENTFINGDMKATEDGNNTVKLAGKSNDGSSLNMFNNISGFENMNITGGNVTFFENAEVTGVEKLTVAKDGTLNLRLKKVGEPNEDGLTKGGHAFSGNGEMVMEGLDTGGTLQFMTNGIGEGVWIDTSDMQIKNMNIETNSVLDGYKFDESGKLVLKPYDNLAGMSQSGSKVEDSKNPTGDGSDIFEHENFESIDGIYKGIYSSTGDNLDALRNLAMTDRNTGKFNGVMSDEEQLKNLQAYLNEIYTQSPYALSSELSRRSAGMFRDIVTENMFRPDLNKWMIMGGLTHIDGGTKDTYYGEVYQMDGKNSLNTEADMKLTGAYALGKYGYSENVALGVTVGGNRSEAELSKSKVKGNSGYIGAFAENYRGNLTLKAGAGIQYSEYDADRSTVGGHSYNDKYSDMTYDIYLNGRYSNPVGENLFLEPYATLSYTYVDQDGTDEGSKALAIKTDSKSFEYTSAEVGVDLKKVIPHEKGKSTLSAGVSYTRLLNGADSDKLTGNFGGSDFDILVAGKNKHNLGLNAKYTLELESGVLFDVKGSYSFERDSHKDNARNRNKGEWMVGAGLGYKF